MLKSRIDRQTTILGYLTIVIYAALFLLGETTLDTLPQFLVTALFFLYSGKGLRRILQERPAGSPRNLKRAEADWDFHTRALNLLTASIIIIFLILVLIRPANMSYLELIKMTTGREEFPVISLP